MFNFLKRRTQKKETIQHVSGSLTESDHDSPWSGDNNTLTNQFLKETAALRGQIEIARRMSPVQEEQLTAIAERLGTEPGLEGNYAKFRELWAAEHGEQVYLNLVDAPVPLRADEQCCFCEPAVWSRLKDSQSRYSVFSNIYPIQNGAVYRIGGLPHYHKSLQELAEIAVGNLIITDKRLLFDGGAISTSIIFQKVLNVECYTNGIELSKAEEGNLFFQMTPLASEYAYMLIQEMNRQG